MTQLNATSTTIRALARNPNTASLPGGVTLVYGDLAAPDSLDAALDGVDAVFLIWPLHTAAVLPAVLDAIKRHARRVVFLGSGGVADLDFAGQHRLINDTGLEAVFIRPSTFAANALWWARQVRAGDVVRGAYGGLAMPMLHEHDIAAVAVHALLEDGPDNSHAGATYTLIGPEAVTQAEQVRAIGEALGRPVRWQEVSRAEAGQQMLTDGFPHSFVDVLLDTYATMLTQPPQPITHTVQEITGTPARTFAQWALDHARDFR